MCVSLWIICGSIQSIQTSQRFTAVYKTLLCVGCSYIAATIQRKENQRVCFQVRVSSSCSGDVSVRESVRNLDNDRREVLQRIKTLMTQCDFLTCSWRKRYWRWSLTPLRLTHRQETHYIIQCQRYFCASRCRDADSCLFFQGNLKQIIYYKSLIYLLWGQFVLKCWITDY